ncbi:MAG: ribosomal-processing cysteine protease Prp [Clostridia bacterium]|nr:ribosomal-processing cysteine protease Prp [Clostridia bacterium]
MIKITIIKNGENVTAISCDGHSGYAESGSDIVCASVSVLTQNAQKTFEEILHINTDYVVDEDVPSLSISLPSLTGEQAKQAYLIMNSTANGLRDIASSFPKYINIKEKRR